MDEKTKTEKIKELIFLIKTLDKDKFSYEINSSINDLNSVLKFPDLYNLDFVLGYIQGLFIYKSLNNENFKKLISLIYVLKTGV